MLSDIIVLAIADEHDMTVVARSTDAMTELDDSVREERVDVVIFSSSAIRLDRERIGRLLNCNPRLGLIEVVPQRDGGTLHHLVATQDEIGPLTRPSLAGAIRTAAALRRR
jgi:hypothetical protein